MKRIILFIALVSLGISVNAQSMKVQSAISDLRNKRLDKAKQNIDDASIHESTKDDAKTWFYKSAIYTDLALTDKPKFKELAENPLDIALEAAMKCRQLDTKGEFAKGQRTDNTTNFQRISIAYYNDAFKFYEKQDYQKALEYFEKVAEVNRLSGDNTTTENALSNAALAAQQLKNEEALKQVLIKLTRVSKSIDPYSSLYQIYKKENDTIEGVKLADRISKRFTNDYRAHIILADAFLWTGEKEKAVEALDKALAIDPSNYLILNAIGASLEQAGDTDGAIEKYLQSLVLKEDQYEANYFLGVLYFNKAVDLNNEANDVPPSDQSGKYDKLKAESDKMFENTIPYLETALKYKDNDYNSLFALKQVYARMAGTEVDTDGKFSTRLLEVNKQLQEQE